MVAHRNVGRPSRFFLQRSRLDSTKFFLCLSPIKTGVGVPYRPGRHKAQLRPEVRKLLRHGICEVLQTGGGDSTILRRVRPYLEEGDVSPFRFSISNACKDMGYYVGMAAEAKVPSGVAAAAHQVYEQAIADGQGDNPVPKMIDYLGKLAGV